MIFHFETTNANQSKTNRNRLIINICIGIQGISKFKVHNKLQLPIGQNKNPNKYV